ncbi:MAG: rod shape-determining protein MreC [Acidimicrobiales bacterium]
MAAPRRPRGRFLLLVLVLVAVTLVTLSTRDDNGGAFARARSYARVVARPFQSGAHSVLQPVGDFINGALNYRSLENENAHLRQQLVSDQAAAVRAQVDEEQAEALLAQEHLDILRHVRSVAAQVIDLGSSNFEQSIEINRGSAYGVAVGQPVVSAGGLVGQVTGVSSHLATVTLMDDPSFTVGVRDVRSGVVGAAVGEGQGNSLAVVDVNVGDQVKKGDPLVTSGLSLEHFPAGVPVGRVALESSQPGVLQLTISMKPLADLVNLQFVRVLLWSPQSSG